MGSSMIPAKSRERHLPIDRSWGLTK